MKRDRLDIRDKMPSGMEEYLAQNGWHFNKSYVIELYLKCAKEELMESLKR